MNLIEEINHVFLLSDRIEKENSIEGIGDLFEYENFDKNEVIEGVNLLLSHIVHEKNDSIKEAMLHSVQNAIVYKDVAAGISLDLLLPYCSSFKIEALSYVLSFLGFSGNLKYLTVLKSYLDHTNLEIQETAQEAISEIEFRSSKKK
ncbi:hypothetical protein HOO54_17150 [Bacillus sp. WMMC1349]|uniref:hypothetical protein n=1 Tax=Bacillus sp. WMMC1349 TaxID=2736254 RepID=UPI0015551C81|nr:hypothetical protein [Bacillus sp. WMMC1349]NPC93895.1 hypothetical protein [Bacillus sp. WMMC1349]